MHRNRFVTLAQTLFTGKILRSRPGREDDDAERIAFVQEWVAEWHRLQLFAYEQLHSEPPTSAYIWRIQAIDAAHHAAEAEMADDVQRKYDSAGGTATTSSS